MTGNSTSARTINSISFIILSQYKATLNIGEEICLYAVASSGTSVSFRSSDTKIASVSKYGIVRAKRAGTVTIIANVKEAEAYCHVTVKNTEISLSKSSASLECGETLILTATTSNHSFVTWKSSKPSIASVDENGTVICKKPGDTIITAKADGIIAYCRVNVKFPTILLNRTCVHLFRGQSYHLIATISSSITPTWKTNKKSIAVVSSNGTITAVKHGTAIITVKADGVEKTCEVVVDSPKIQLNTYELTLKKGSKSTLSATVSSGNKPSWSSSNDNVVAVTKSGEITGVKQGTAYIYATEDGTKCRCTIHVIN